MPGLTQKESNKTQIADTPTEKAVNMAANKGISVMSWNIAGINRNPMEFWIHTDDESYNKLMDKIELFINSPGEQDVAVSEVFTEDMFQELIKRMEGIDTMVSGVDFVKQVWAEDYSKRAIVSGFMKDKVLGEKRIASMPDRVTNVVETVSGPVCRPTIINNFETDLPNNETWFRYWMEFMFESEFQDKSGKPGKIFPRLKSISKAKYPAITEEESMHSIPLQTLGLAIFDAIMVHMMNTVGEGVWFDVKSSIYRLLNENKIPLLYEILFKKYSNCDVILLQEVSSEFVNAFEGSPLDRAYSLIKTSDFDSDREQNSVALLKKATFKLDSYHDLHEMVTPELRAMLQNGDLLLFSIEDVKDTKYIMASFHGDTAGKSSIPCIKLCGQLADKFSGHCFLLGMDANCYKHVTKGKLHVDDFHAAFVQQGFVSTFDVGVDSKHFPCTTMNARTYCQPQLNKAVRRSDVYIGNKNVDSNPKDFILYKQVVSGKSFKITSSGVDNTGKGFTELKDGYDESIWMPGASFPSDHAIVTATLVENQNILL